MSIEIDGMRERIAQAFAQNPGSIRAAARLAGVSFETARKYAPANTPGVPMTLDIRKITLDPATQPRAEMHDGTIENYKEVLQEGGEFETNPVVFFDGKVYWLADGWHRIHAALRANLTAIECDIRQGTRRDAILFSVGANAKHGLPRSNADKRRAVLTVMQDEEWKEKYSNREVARLCGVTHAMTNAMRRELEGGSAFHPETSPSTNGTANGHVSKPSIPLMNGHPSPPDPARPDDPADVAAGRRNGTIPAGVEVEVIEPDRLKVEAPSTLEPEMTDAEYLESLSARPHLADHVRKRFDVEALTFRRVSAHRRAFASACKPLTNAAKNECQGHIGPWMGRHFHYLRSYDPTRWQACKDCSGSGQLPLLGQCPACHGEGYHV